MQVDYGQLSLASQVLRRQQESHTRAVSEYIQRYGILTPSDTGIVMLPFTGVSLAVAMLGVQASDMFGQVCSLAADRVDDAARAYEAHEKQAHEAAQALLQQLGLSLPPYQGPSAPPTLGAAGSGAPSDHGSAEPDLISEIIGTPDAVSGGISDLYDDATSRADGWSGAGAVSERSDATSWLVAPNATKSEIENMRWGAGPILGGVDWLIEQLVGLSLLEDVIMKPFAGDWTGIEEVQQAWSHVGEAMRGISDNAAGLAETGTFWQGDAGTAYQGGMTAIGLGAFGLGSVADSVAGLVGQLVLASKTAAATIGFAINQLSQTLMRMALEATVPIAGWIVAAAEGALAATKIFGVIRLIYSIINIIYDVIESVVTARAQLVENLLRLEDLAQVLVQTSRKYA